MPCTIKADIELRGKQKSVNGKCNALDDTCPALPCAALSDLPYLSASRAHSLHTASQPARQTKPIPEIPFFPHTRGSAVGDWEVTVAYADGPMPVPKTLFPLFHLILRWMIRQDCRRHGGRKGRKGKGRKGEERFASRRSWMDGWMNE